MDCCGTIKDQKSNPRENANFLSVITFFYNYKILKNGRKQELEENDIFKVLPDFEAEKLGDKLEKQWKKDCKKNVKIWITLLKTFGLTYFLYTIFQLIVSTFIILYQPKIFSKFVNYFEYDRKIATKFDAYIYAAELGGLSLLNVFFTHNMLLLVAEYSLKVRTAVSSLIFRKTLRISPTGFSEIKIGKTITLITKDVFAIDAALTYIKDIFIGFLQLKVITYVLYHKIGISGLPLFAVIIFIILCQIVCGTIASNIRLETNKKTDERFDVTQEVLSSVKNIKMYRWQGFFLNIINTLRLLEIKNLAKVYYVKAVIKCLGEFAIYIFYFTLLYYIMAKNQALDSETIFFVLNCLFILRTTVSLFPIGISNTADLIASFKRIQSFLEADEVPHRSYLETPIPKIYLNKIKITINKEEILRSVSLQLTNGLLVITGNSGSGKSILLKAILKELPIESGDLERNGNISYAPQEPWIFPSTVRQNILFGEPYNLTRYREVLKICALNYDINSDDKITIDGNLSKGEKARISLARAVYRDSDIYLLDDCLAVLDNNTAEFIFKHCIQGFLKDKICLFATNKIHSTFLMGGNSILYIENGSTLSLGQQNRGLDKRITYFIDEEINLQKARQSSIPENNNYLINNDSDNENNKLMLLAENKNIYAEEKKSGSITCSTYTTYYTLMGGFLSILYLAVTFGAAEAALYYFDKLFKKWINTQIEINYNEKFGFRNSTEYNQLLDTRKYCFKFYAILLLSGIIISIIKSFSTFFACLNAASNLHNQLITAMLKTSIKFFDNHFVGNVINRLSKDLYVVDEYMPFLVFDIFRLVISMISVLILTCLVNWMLFIPGILFLIKCYFLQKIYLPTGRSLRRLEASTRSPIIGYLNSAIEGITVTRSSQQDRKLIAEFDRHQDLYTSVYHMNQTTMRLFAFLLELFSTFFVIGISIKLILFFGGSSAVEVTIILLQSMSLSETLQNTIRQFSELELAMTSVERILEYSKTTPERLTGKVPDNWPSKGAIKFHNVSVTYDNAEVLSNVNFEIAGGEKIGIVGTSASGKTSLVSTLFRLYDYQGTILIDNEDINSLSIDFLRSHITLIPQDPIIFSGTIRANIDPFNEFSDEDIWKALEDVQMKKHVLNLNQPIKNYSASEKQLLCLARALISQNKIIILDEPTATLDTDLEIAIQKLIESRFKKCTVIIVTNKTSSILWCDKIVNLRYGKIIETDI